jgi:acyl-CoA thioesterase
MSDFETDTRLNCGEDGQWQGTVSPHWGIGDNPNGGYLVSIAMRALAALNPSHPDPLTITAHYLRPGVPSAPCTVEADLIRAGRTITTARARLEQEGKSRIEVLAGFGDLTAGSQDDTRLTVPAPTLPPPADCLQRSGEEQGVHLPILDRLDIRLHPDEARAGTAGQAQVSGWVRFRDGSPADSLAAVLFTDAFPPSLFGLLGIIGWMPTLELTVHVRRRPAPGWICGQFRTEDLNDGRMIEDGALWDENGDLIAQSRQVGLLLRN